MRLRAAHLLLLPALLLAACSSSVLTPEDKALPEDTGAFTGQNMEIDYDQSYISFVGGSDIVDHESEFEKFAVVITPDAAAPADFTKATVVATIDLTSVKTDADGLNGHMQKADFFDTATYPEATFTSTSITEDGEGHYDITGDFTLKGVTKPLTLEAELTDSYLLATGEIPRKEFGVGNDTYGQKLIDETVPLEAKLVFVR